MQLSRLDIRKIVLQLEFTKCIFHIELLTSITRPDDLLTSITCLVRRSDSGQGACPTVDTPKLSRSITCPDELLTSVTCPDKLLKSISRPDELLTSITCSDNLLKSIQ